MPRNRAPIFKKISNLVRASILLSKLRRKPINLPKLVFFKKSSRKLKIFKLVKHYNYGFVQEYEFSPSTTPPLMIHFHKKQSFNHVTRSCRDNIRSVLFMCKCLGGYGGETGGNELVDFRSLPGIYDVGENYLQPLDHQLGSEEEEDSVDERAERFIENFYQAIRMQRHESF